MELDELKAAWQQLDRRVGEDGDAVGPAVVRAATAAESCADPASQSLRAAMNYANASADPAKTCGGCAFFTRDESLQACGQCTIMSSLVDEGGVCGSWAGLSG